MAYIPYPSELELVPEVQVLRPPQIMKVRHVRFPCEFYCEVLQKLAEFKRAICPENIKITGIVIKYFGVDSILKLRRKFNADLPNDTAGECTFE